jgi:predicted outer membrane repeat protein
MKARAFSRLGLAGAAVLLASVAVAQAKIIRVDVNGGADFRTIKPAVSAAQSGDTIIVAPGTYTGDGVLDIVLAGKVLTIQSTDPSDPEVVAATVIDCQTKDELGHRFIEISRDTGAGLTVAGLKMIHGALGYAGGIILCQGADLHLINCSFSDNSVEWWGGAVHCEDSTVTIENCTFARNSSIATHGGAVACQRSALSLTGCTFRRNTGNALELLESVVTIDGCTFTNNSGRAGGAIYSFTAGDKDAAAYLSVTNCIFSGNYCTESGAALHNYGTEASIDSCSFTSNRAGKNGGAIYNYQCAPSITSCIFISNTAVDIGGAIANYQSSAPTIFNATFVKNQAASGGAISSRRESDPLISHCILWDNEATAGPNLYLGRDPVGIFYGSKATVEYSDVKEGQASVHADSGCVLTWAAGNLDAIPHFRGATYDDYRLNTESPCIDAGDPDYRPSPKETDLDGRARLFGKTVDMGAYENQGVDLDPVYRFWAPSRSRPFYTIEEWERDILIDVYPNVWHFEGISFYAYKEDTGGTEVPVYRFWSALRFDHIWTTSEKERDRLLRESALWSYEGVVFYAFEASDPPLGTVPVYRLLSTTQNRHFYTADEEEKDALLKDSPGGWINEGVSFYVYASSHRPDEVTYALSGGAGEARINMTLAAYVDGQAARIDAPTIEFTVDSTRMRLTADFINLTTTLDETHITGQTTTHTTTIRQSGASGITIPFSIAVQPTFAALSSRGPFALDLATGRFADYVDAPETLPGNRETFAYSGSATLGGEKLTFDQTADAQELELSSFGAFKSLSSFSENVTVSLPQTFQWRRGSARDLLLEATVNKRRVQVFVTDLYTATEGAWEGMATD